METARIENALISVSDKLGLAEFARGLASAGVRIYSTGGTARHLRENGLEVVDVAQYTGFPEMMDGRVKTLHPKIFAGILCRRDRQDDMRSIQEHQIVPMDLVVVNLYPFEATIARPGVTPEQAIEQIDIGGPSLVRAAAKNHAFVTIATDPEQYAEILEQIQQHGGTHSALRQWLASEAFHRTARYDAAISRYFAKMTDQETSRERFPHHLNLSLERVAPLRYGENPHQRAALYSFGHAEGPSLITARQLNGKELSYNNLLDLDAALAIVRGLPRAAATVIKHSNPCGAASAADLSVALERAFAGDPVSAFGSILGVNRPLDRQAAEVLCTPGLFIEAIIAPEYDAEALELLKTKPRWRNNVRIMETGSLDMPAEETDYRHVEGGMLLQDADIRADDPAQWRVVTKTPLPEALQPELEFAWTIVRYIKSNAIAVTRDQSLCGAGAGQMSRVDSVQIALQKAQDRSQGAVLSSDAFFPFPDSIEQAAKAGIQAIIQPGGSKRDEEVIRACDQFGLPMVFTGRRHFRH